LAQDTPVMLLDEPTAFLDYKSKVEMLALLSRLAHETNKMVLLSTHDLEQAVHTADALWVVSKAPQAANTPQKSTSNAPHQHPDTHLRVLERHIRTDEQGLQQIAFESEDEAENTAPQGLTLTATADFDQRTHALLHLLGEGQ
jgi:achromobactin ABC superfamily ATP binding cassette transporter, ABC protein